MRNKKAIPTIFLILLSATLLLSVVGTASVSAQGTGSAVTVYSTIGGTTNPPAGTTDTSGTLTISAYPDSGYQFAYWIYQGPDTTGHGIQGVDTTIYTDNPLSIPCAAGYTVQFEAVFVPAGSAYATPGISIGWIVLAVALVAAVVGVIAFVAGRRLSK